MQFIPFNPGHTKIYKIYDDLRREAVDTGNHVFLKIPKEADEKLGFKTARKWQRS